MYFYVSKCFACMHVSIPSTCLMPMEFRRGAGVRDGWQPQYGCWELSTDPLPLSSRFLVNIILVKPAT